MNKNMSWKKTLGYKTWLLNIKGHMSYLFFWRLNSFAKLSFEFLEVRVTHWNGKPIHETVCKALKSLLRAVALSNSFRWEKLSQGKGVIVFLCWIDTFYSNWIRFTWKQVDVAHNNRWEILACTLQLITIFWTTLALISHFFMMKSNAYMLKEGSNHNVAVLKWMLKTHVTQPSRKNFRFNLFSV